MNLSERLVVRFVNGKPGAGKDLQANWLSETYPAFHKQSTGDIIRGATPNGPFRQYYPWIAADEASHVSGGGFLKEETMLKIFQDYLSERIVEGQRAFIFTGFPRNNNQLLFVDDWFGFLRSKGWEIWDSHLVVNVPTKVAMARIEGRWESGLASGDPRPDDDPAVVGRRFELYDENTEPMLETMRAQRRPWFKEVDGDADIFFSKVSEISITVVIKASKVPLVLPKASYSNPTFRNFNTCVLGKAV